MSLEDYEQAKKLLLNSNKTSTFYGPQWNGVGRKLGDWSNFP